MYASLGYCWSIIHFCWIFVFLVAVNCSSVALGNNFLYIILKELYMYIMALCFPHYLCQLYMIPLLWLWWYFWICFYLKWLVLKLIELIFTLTVISFSWSASCSILWTTLLFTLLHTSQKWFILLHFVYFFPNAGYHLYWWLEPQYLHFFPCRCFDGCMQFFPILFLIISWCLYFVKLHLTQDVNDHYLGSFGLNSFCPC